MILNIVFWVFLIGILVASFQDLKRREVDNWLNLLLLVFGWAFIIFQKIFNLNTSVIVLGGVSFLAMFVLANVFYYGRIFAGGDAKLLFAMFVVFVGTGFAETLVNIAWFVLLLMFAGGIWGLGWMLGLFILNFKKIKKEFKKGFGNIYFRYAFFAGIILFVLSYVDWFFLLPAVLFLVVPVLYVFAKSLEKVAMIKEVSPKDLTEGDWLVKDIRVDGKVVKAEWDGLSLDDIKLLKQRRKKVKVKYGLPFTPAFLIAFLVYWFCKNWLLEILVGI